MDEKNTKQLDNANREHQPTPPHGDKLWPEQGEQKGEQKGEQTPPEDADVPKSLPEEKHEHGRELI